MFAYEDSLGSRFFFPKGSEGRSWFDLDDLYTNDVHRTRKEKATIEGLVPLPLHSCSFKEGPCLQKAEKEM